MRHAGPRSNHLLTERLAVFVEEVDQDLGSLFGRLAFGDVAHFDPGFDNQLGDLPAVNADGLQRCELRPPT